MPHNSIVCVHVINIGGFLKVLLADVYLYMYFFSVSNTSFLALKYNKKVKCLDHWEFFLSVHHYTLIFIIIYTCNVKKFWIPNECVLDFFFNILQNKLLNNTKTLLKEAAEREQRLLTENQDLKQRVGQRSRSIQLGHWLSYNYLMIKEDNSVCDEAKYKYSFSTLLMLRVISLIFSWKKGAEIEKLCEN